MGEHEFCGIEVIAELYGCRPPEKLNDGKYLKKIVEKAVKLAGMKVVKTFIVKFEPQGVDIACILAESSLWMHPYPEYGHTFVNIFTCGRKANPQKALEYLVKELNPIYVKNRKPLKRGLW